VNPTTGLYATGVANSVIANPNPDWLAGLTNTFSYKGITLSALLDVRYGGDLYSFDDGFKIQWIYGYHRC